MLKAEIIKTINKHSLYKGKFGKRQTTQFIEELEAHLQHCKTKDCHIRYFVNIWTENKYPLILEGKKNVKKTR